MEIEKPVSDSSESAAGPVQHTGLGWRSALTALICFLRSLFGLLLGAAAWFALRALFAFLVGMRITRLEQMQRAADGDEPVLVLACLSSIVSYFVAGWMAARIAVKFKMAHAMALGAVLAIWQLLAVFRAAGLGQLDSQLLMRSLGVELSLATASIAFGGWLGHFLSPARKWEEYGQPLFFPLPSGEVVEIRSARRSIAGAAVVYALAALFPLGTIVLLPLITESGNDDGFLSSGGHQHWAMLSLTISLAFFHTARRMHAPSLQRAMMDNRLVDSVVYLRPFDDDDSAIYRGSQYDFIGVNTERDLCKLLRRIGPVLAIGRPGEALPPTGAVRMYVRDKDWQKTLTSVAAHAKLVVLRVGNTSGVKWELANALAMLRPEQFVLFIAGTTRQTRGEVYDDFFKWANGQLPVSLPKSMHDSCLIVFGTGWQAEKIPRDSFNPLRKKESPLIAVYREIARTDSFYLRLSPVEPAKNSPARIFAMLVCFLFGGGLIALGVGVSAAFFMAGESIISTLIVGGLLASVGALFIGLGWYNRGPQRGQNLSLH